MQPEPEFAVRDAVATIERWTGYDVPLRRRTAAASWMVWGLATALVPVIYSVAFDLNVWTWWFMVVFPLGWPLLGLLPVALLWRIAGITERRLSFSLRRTVLAMAAGAALMLATIEVSWYLFGRAGADAATLATFTLVPWAILAAVQWTRLLPEGRRTTVGTAVAMAALVAGYAAVGGPLTNETTVLAYAAIAGGVPFGVGAWRMFVR